MAKRHTAVERDPFEVEAVEVLGGLKRSLTTVLAALGIRRAGDLQKQLKLDTTLAYQIFRVIAEGPVLASGPSMPSRIAIERFVRSASTTGASSKLLDHLLTAYVRFEQLVEKHAGDRTTFNSLVTGVTGTSEEWLNADLQHRRNMFRGMSHVMGLQAQLRFSSTLFGPTGKGRHNAATLLGYSGLRFLRPTPKLRVHGIYIEHNAPHDAPVSERQPLVVGGHPDNFLMDGLSSSPRPTLIVDRGEGEGHDWMETSLINPKMGNVGVSNLIFGEKWRYCDELDAIHHTVSVPSEALIQDVLFYPDMIKGAPTSEVVLANMRTHSKSIDAMRLEGNCKITSLGRGTDVLALPEVPDYPSVVRAVAEELGYDSERFEAWRVTLEFPVYHSVLTTGWERIGHVQSDR